MKSKNEKTDASVLREYEREGEVDFRFITGNADPNPRKRK